MRLIDADKLIEDAKRDFCYPEAFEKMVGEQPTDYDVDKVIEDLEKYARSDICGGCRSCRYIDADNVSCEQCGALGALAIVKGGGIQYERATEKPTYHQPNP